MAHFWLEFEAEGHRQRYDFDQASVSIGREDASDFHLNHPTVSRQHALIVENYGQHQLVVLSRNGLTAVDGEVVSGTVDLRPGMTIQVGEVQLGFRAPIGDPNVSDVATEAVSLDQINPHAPTNAMNAVREEATEPSRDAFNAPQQNPGGYGPMSLGGGGGGGAPQQQQQQQQQQGFGQNPANSGFGQMSIGGQQQQQQQQQQQPNGGGNGVDGDYVPPSAKAEAGGGDGDEFKIKSWEEIAAEAATGAHDAVSGPTDFERIQRAQAKATKKSGTSPTLLGALVVAVAGLAVLFLYEPDKAAGPKKTKDPERCADLRICYPKEAEPECANPSDCEAKAEQAYAVADELTQKKDANITNRYEAYKQLDKAARYILQAGLEEPPASMKDFDDRLLQYEKELDDIAKEHQIRHHQLQQRNMYQPMADNICSWMAFFPDTYNTWYKQAINEERRMKDVGTWPEGFDCSGE